MKKGLFSSYYLAPIEFFHHYMNMDEIVLDEHENFVKQTYRSRCYIMGPNGVQSLSVPLQSVQKKQRVKDIKISNVENWQKIHWKSLEAGYRRSAYFEFYEHLFEPCYTKTFNYLIDFNNELQSILFKAIEIDEHHSISECYIENTGEYTDFRTSFTPKNNQSNLEFPRYSQVFEDRNAFAPNLSTIDLLFNLGPSSKGYITSIKIKEQ